MVYVMIWIGIWPLRCMAIVRMFGVLGVLGSLGSLEGYGAGAVLRTHGGTDARYKNLHE